MRLFKDIEDTQRSLDKVNKKLKRLNKIKKRSETQEKNRSYSYAEQFSLETKLERLQELARQNKIYEATKKEN